MNKSQQYETLLKQAAALIDGESDLIANQANICALLKETFGWLWVGFYRADAAVQQLILGPFQGPLACTRIDYGKGVCGEVWKNGKTQVVPDVHAHPNHIACSSLSNSEIVVPVKNRIGKVVAVLDIDSSELATFEDIDAQWLERLSELLATELYE